MDFQSSWGGLLPLWIIGAPWLLAVVMLTSTPKRRALDDRRTRVSRSASAGAEAYDRRPLMQVRVLPASRR